MTPETLAELKRLDAAATQGPWTLHLVDDTTVIDDDGRFIASVCGGDDDLGGADYNNPTEWPILDANAALIAAMRNALPALIAAAERVAELEVEARRDLERAHSDTTMLLGFAQICTENGLAPTSGELVAACKRARAALAGDA